jgi:hypothetical protein
MMRRQHVLAIAVALVYRVLWPEAGDVSAAIAWIPLLTALGLGASATSNAVSSSKQNESQRQMSREEIAAQKEMQAREIALKESELNPFRQQLAQAGSIASLDRLERGAYKPVTLQGAAPYAQYKPQMSGGYSYEKSPELVASAGALKKDVMSGNRAPSAIQPPGSSQPADLTALLDLLAMLYPDDAYPATRRPAGVTRPPADTAGRTLPGRVGGMA